MFTFYDPGRLVNADLELVLVEQYPGDPTIGYLPAYRFHMQQVGHDEPIGRIELRVGYTHDLIMYGGHFGYQVDLAYRGQRYAARACRLLLPLAQRHGLETVWITCSPDNVASARTCELAGAVLVEVVDLPPHNDMYLAGERRKCRYRIDLSCL